jgi:hypothetical protein
LRPHNPSPAINTIKDSVLSISNPQFIELMKAVLEKGASFRFRAGGSSMVPFIRDGDVLTLMLLKNGPSPGEVCAFVHPQNGKLIVHRLVGRKNNMFRFKGDNTREADGYVQLENILGKVVSVERHKKKVHLGLGIERYVISLMSITNILPLMTTLAYPLYRFTKKVIPCL